MVGEKDGEREADAGSATIPFLPAGSSAEAIVVVAEAPRRFPAGGRVLGYDVP